MEDTATAPAEVAAQSTDPIDAIISEGFAEIKAAETEPAEPTEPAEDTAPEEPEQTETEKLAKEVKRLKNALSRKDKKIGRSSFRIDQLSQEIHDLKSWQQKPEPEVDDFEDYGKFLTATTDDRLDRRQTQNDIKAKEIELQNSKEELRSSREQAMNEDEILARKAFPDFEKVTGRSNILLSDAATSAIHESDSPAMALYSILKDGLLDHFNDLSPAMAGAMMQEHLMKAQALAKPKKLSNAPNPMTPARGGASGEKSIDQMSPEQLKTWFNSKD